MKATYVTHSGNDLLVVNAARVSFDKESELEDDGFTLREADTRLLSYLARHKHWTPFAHPQITLHIRAPIFVRTQCFKHKVGFTENEVSRRYVDTPPECFIPVWRKRAVDKKQGSLNEFPDNLEACDYLYNTVVKGSLASYKMLLALGVAPEQARMVLPQSMYTEWYWTGSLAAYARFHYLRASSDAQVEVQELAEQIGHIIAPLFPYSWAALNEVRNSS